MPALFSINLTIFIIQIIATCSLWWHFNASPKLKIATKKSYLITLQLIVTLHWGILTAYIIYACNLDQNQQDMMRIITTGYAGVSGVLWGIAHPMGLASTTLMVGPHLLASYWFKDTNAHFYALLTAQLLLYIYLSTRLTLRTAFLQLISEYNLVQVHAESMDHLCKLDFVTKLLNHFHFLLDYEIAWNNAKSTKNPLSLICFQVDAIDKVNVQHSHQVGDAVIAATAASLKDAFAVHQAVLGRYDTNRIMIALPNMDLAQANTFANAECEIIRQQILFPQQLSTPLNVSYYVIDSADHMSTSSQVMIEALIKQVESDHQRS